MLSHLNHPKYFTKQLIKYNNYEAKFFILGKRNNIMNNPHIIYERLEDKIECKLKP